MDTLCRRVLDVAWRARLAYSPGQGQAQCEVIQDHAAFPLPSEVQNRLIEHVQALQAIVEQRSEDASRRIHALEPGLHECVREVFRVIEMLVTTASAWEGPLARRLRWLQKQMVALQERVVVMKTEFLKKKNQHDLVAHHVRCSRPAWPPMVTEGEEQKDFSELRALLEDPMTMA